MAIQAIFYDEYGRITSRTEEIPGERVYTAAHLDNGAKQIGNEWKGTQRRPAARAFSRHLNEEF